MDYDFYKSKVDDESKLSIDKLLSNNIALQKIFEFYELEIKKNNSILLEKEIANKRKLEFICHLSHDFKIPLNSINGFVSLIIEQSQHQEQILSYCANIKKASNHLYDLLESSLNMARAETDDVELEYGLFETFDIILETLCVLNVSIKRKNIIVETNLSKILINADKRRFRQILYNLIGNAIKFNKPNGKIRIKTFLKDNCFHFEIQDTGCGIDYDNQPKVFDFFSCFDCNRFDDIESTGIGLSLCKKLITLQGGKIDFNSTPKMGSTFWFYLPIDKRELFN